MIFKKSAWVSVWLPLVVVAVEEAVGIVALMLVMVELMIFTGHATEGDQLICLS